MSCVMCFGAVATRGHESLVRCAHCVAVWCVSCHEKWVLAFVTTTLDHIEELTVDSHVGMQCPCRRRLMAPLEITRALPTSYLRHYVDGIHQLHRELALMERTMQWLQANPTWISATTEHMRIRRIIAEFDMAIGEQQQRVADCRTELQMLACECATDARSPECAKCNSTRRRLSELQIECDALQSIRSRHVGDLQRSVRSTPGLFREYRRAAVTTPISDVLSSVTGARAKGSFARWDKYGSPVTFFTFLHLRIGHILRLKSHSAYVFDLIHVCRRRNLLHDLVRDLEDSCRKASHTGVRRWRQRAKLSPCAVDAAFQRDFMHCVEHARCPCC